MLLKDLSTNWLQRLQIRKRKPIKPATIAAFSSALRNHIVPLLGEMDTESFGNKQLREFAEALVAKSLSPKTCHELVGMVQQIFKSAQDENGDALYPKTFNLNFVLENVPDITNQKQPMISREDLNAALRDKSLPIKARVWVALAAGTGLRIGEMMALRIGGVAEGGGSFWDSTSSTIKVCQSIWSGQLQSPKTAASVRDVEISTPLNKMLVEFTRGRSAGEFLFATKSGRPIEESYIRAYILKPLGIPGAHVLRRYRISWLREVGCNESILRAWVGHSNGGSITNIYDKSTNNVKLRHDWSERVGTGLDLGDVCVGRPRIAAPKPSKPSKSAQSSKPRTKFIAKLVPHKLRKQRSMVPLIEQVISMETSESKPSYQAADTDLDSFFTSELVAKEMS